MVHIHSAGTDIPPMIITYSTSAVQGNSPNRGNQLPDDALKYIESITE